MKGFPVVFGIGVRGPKCLNDGPTRWSKKFSDRFNRFDTIGLPAVADSHPASQPPSHVAVTITLNAKASSLKIIERLKPDIVSSPNYCPLQSAYRSAHSTETALVKMVDDILGCMDSGSVAVVVGLDISAACLRYSLSSNAPWPSRVGIRHPRYIT